jgi:hypothetical protein
MSKQCENMMMQESDNLGQPRCRKVEKTLASTCCQPKDFCAVYLRRPNDEMTQ